MTKEQIQAALKELDANWRVELNKLKRSFVFKDFKEAMIFLNQVAQLAEEEGHHPDFQLHYNKVDLELWTHAIGGLSENDFIVATKIDQIGWTYE